MSLTLDEVRRVRFRMARRNAGYEVSDVDLFIDKVESAFQQFENERDLLRREAEAGEMGGGGQAHGVSHEELEAKDREIAQLREELERQNVALTADAGEEAQNHIQELSSRNEEMSAELQRVRAELSDVRSQRVGESAGKAELIQVTSREEASPAVIRLVQLATEQAEQLVDEAETEASRKLEEAKQQAREITTDARTKADRIESEARVNAEQVTNEAESRAAKLNGETAARREELFAELEHEQGVLTGKVDSLRGFEQQYRSNLGGSLQQLLSALEEDHPQPLDVPELAEAPSETPRLDALASDSQE